MLWAKLLFFAISGGVLFKQFIDSEVQKQGGLYWFLVFTSVIVTLYLGADLSYHFITHDSEKIGFPRWVVQQVGFEATPDTTPRQVQIPDCSKILSTQASSPNKETLAQCELERLNALERIQFAQAKALGTAQPVAEYLRSCRVCRDKTEAEKLLVAQDALAKNSRDDALFTAAKTANSIPAFKRYLDQCDVCRYASNAKAEIEAQEELISFTRKHLLAKDRVDIRRSGNFIYSGEFAIDIVNKRMWRRCALGQDSVEGRCSGFAQQYHILDLKDREEYIEYGGYPSWRIPLSADLRTILDTSKGSKTEKRPFINSSIFPDLATDTMGLHKYLARKQKQELDCLEFHFDTGETEEASWCTHRGPFLLVRDISP